MSFGNKVMPTGYLRNHFFMFVFNLAPLWCICLVLKGTSQYLILLLGSQYFANLFFLMFLSSLFPFSCNRLVSPQKASWDCPFFWKLSTGVVQTAHTELLAQLWSLESAAKGQAQQLGAAASSTTVALPVGNTWPDLGVCF